MRNCRDAAVALILFSVVLAANTSVGITVDHATFLSSEPDADCSQYKSIVCEIGGLEQVNYDYLFHDGHKNESIANQDICLPNVTTCSIQSLPQLTYQLIYENTTTKYIIIHVKWNPVNESDCIPDEYHVVVKSSSIDIGSTCNDIVNGAKYYSVNTSTNEIYYARYYKEANIPNLYFKVIAYPVYEYPILIVNIPDPCSYNNFFGCQFCDSNCKSTYSVPVPLLSVDPFFTSPTTIAANLSWQQVDRIKEFYLHLNSSTFGKRLYRIKGDAEIVTINDIPYDSKMFVYLEQFYCGCSKPSIIYSVHKALNHSIDPVIPSTSSDILLPTNSISTIAKSISTIASDTNSISASDTNGISSTNTVASTKSVFSNNLKSTDKVLSESGPLLAAIYIPTVIIFLIIISMTVIIVLFVSLSLRKRKINPKGEPMPPPAQGLNTPEGSIDSLPPTVRCSIVIIIPHDEPNKEEYLSYLSNVTDYGINLLLYDRSTRDTPSDWLNTTALKPDTLVLIVVSKQFHQEWNGERKADVPLVFALKQLVNCLFQQSRELKNFALILPTQTDNKHIPNTLQSITKFKLCEIEDIVRYVLQVPEYDCH